MVRYFNHSVPDRFADHEALIRRSYTDLFELHKGFVLRAEHHENLRALAKSLSRRSIVRGRTNAVAASDALNAVLDVFFEHDMKSAVIFSKEDIPNAFKRELYRTVGKRLLEFAGEAGFVLGIPMGGLPADPAPGPRARTGHGDRARLPVRGRSGVGR